MRGALSRLAFAMRAWLRCEFKPKRSHRRSFVHTLVWLTRVWLTRVLATVMSSSHDGPVGTVLLSMTSSTLDDKKETVDLELSVDEFMKLKNKLMDASREMRLA